jgi:hypothetical protein
MDFIFRQGQLRFWKKRVQPLPGPHNTSRSRIQAAEVHPSRWSNPRRQPRDSALSLMFRSLRPHHPPFSGCGTGSGPPQRYGVGLVDVEQPGVLGQASQPVWLSSNPDAPSLAGIHFRQIPTTHAVQHAGHLPRIADPPHPAAASGRRISSMDRQGMTTVFPAKRTASGVVQEPHWCQERDVFSGEMSAWHRKRSPWLFG